MNSNAWDRKVYGCFQEHRYLEEDEVRKRGLKI